ncbi:MAG TPA: hypothetical protein PKW66_15515 [Polyangiaceae bacterium]|nr:hypothetical protein [Polyangiaceae bacterium]
MARSEQDTLLGYTITRHDGKPQLKVAAKSVQRLKAKHEPLFRQGCGMKHSPTLRSPTWDS